MYACIKLSKNFKNVIENTVILNYKLRVIKSEILSRMPIGIELCTVETVHKKAIYIN